MPKYMLLFVGTDDWYDRQSKEELAKAYALSWLGG